MTSACVLWAPPAWQAAPPRPGKGGAGSRWGRPERAPCRGRGRSGRWWWRAARWPSGWRPHGGYASARACARAAATGRRPPRPPEYNDPIGAPRPPALVPRTAANWAAHCLPPRVSTRADGLLPSAAGPPRQPSAGVGSPTSAGLQIISKKNGYTKDHRSKQTSRVSQARHRWPSAVPGRTVQTIT